MVEKHSQQLSENSILGSCYILGVRRVGRMYQGIVAGGGESDFSNSENEVLVIYFLMSFLMYKRRTLHKTYPQYLNQLYPVCF